MTNYTVLDNVAHADIKVDRRYSPKYGDDINQARVFVTEFEELQREYAIFFRRDETGQYYAVTLLGLDLNENLFLGDMDWDARYVPAIMQRGPFQIGVPKEGDPIIKIDLDSPRINSEHGMPLFERNGGLTPYLGHISDVLKKIHIGLEMNGEFFHQLVDASLIEAVTLDLKLNDKTSYSLPGIYSINETAFQALNGTVLENFHTSGLLSLCQYVLSSRKNVRHLLDQKTMKISVSG